MSKDEILTVGVSQIRCGPQPRTAFNEPELESLAISLKAAGQLQPLLVYRDGDTFVVLEGERRLRAATLAGLPSLQVLVRPKPADAATKLVVQLVTNLQRADLSPIERAKGIRDLMSAKSCSAAEAAAALGLSTATVSRDLALLGLPEEVQKQVGTTVSPSVAYELTKITDPAERANLTTAAANGTLTRDALAGRVRSGKRAASSAAAASAPTAASPAASNRAVASLTRGRTITLAVPDLTLDTAIDTLEDLLNRLRRARTQGLALPTVLRMLRDTAKS